MIESNHQHTPPSCALPFSLNFGNRNSGSSNYPGIRQPYAQRASQSSNGAHTYANNPIYLHSATRREAYAMDAKEGNALSLKVMYVTTYYILTQMYSCTNYCISFSLNSTKPKL